MDWAAHSDLDRYELALASSRDPQQLAWAQGVAGFILRRGPAPVDVATERGMLALFTQDGVVNGEAVVQAARILALSAPGHPDADRLSECARAWQSLGIW